MNKTKYVYGNAYPAEIFELEEEVNHYGNA